MRTLWVVEYLRANGEIFGDGGHFSLWNAIDEVYECCEDDKCCNQNTSEDKFLGPCPGGCETRSPRIVEFVAERVAK